MDTSSLIITIVSQVISFGSAITLFILSSKQNTKQSKSEIYKERVLKLYAPFYQKCMIGMYQFQKPSELPKEVADTYLNILSDNIIYMGTNSQKIFPTYYHSYLKHYISSSDYSPNDKKHFKEQYDKIFKEITNSLLSEYTYLCKKLKLELPVKIF